MLEKLKARVDELKIQLEQSVANHHVMLGAFHEATNLYESMKAAAPAVEEAIAEVAPIVEEIAQEF